MRASLLELSTAGQGRISSLTTLQIRAYPLVLPVFLSKTWHRALPELLNETCNVQQKSTSTFKVTPKLQNDLDGNAVPIPRQLQLAIGLVSFFERLVCIQQAPVRRMAYFVAHPDVGSVSLADVSDFLDGLLLVFFANPWGLAAGPGPVVSGRVVPSCSSVTPCVSLFVSKGWKRSSQTAGDILILGSLGADESQ